MALMIIGLGVLTIARVLRKPQMFTSIGTLTTGNHTFISIFTKRVQSTVVLPRTFPRRIHT